jgi:hypothetical protein
MLGGPWWPRAVYSTASGRQSDPLCCGLNISQAASEEAISAVRQAKREQGSCRNTNETCSCFNSAAAWDWYVLRALEALGSIERVSNQSWRWK